jgi:hypothetical protein
VDVGWVCTQLGGGGHSQAAGFTADGPVAQIMSQLRDLLDRAGPARRATAPSVAVPSVQAPGLEAPSLDESGR